MPEDNATTQNEADASQETTQETTVEEWDGDLSVLPTGAQKYIKELRSESKNKRLALKKLEDEQRERDQKLLEKQGEYKQLADDYRSELVELRPLKEQYEARLAKDAQKNEERISKLPESVKLIIPPGLSPSALADWLDALKASNLLAPSAPNIDAGAGVGTSGSRPKPITLTQEQRDYAKAAGMTDEQYAESLSKLRR